MPTTYTTLKNPSCFLYAPFDAKIEDAPYPTIKDQHDVIIRIAYVGVCGSDIHFWEHGGVITYVSQCNPVIMGHEASGVVHEIGTLVTTLKPGDRVAIEPGYPCRRCKVCKSGKYHLCLKMIFAANPPNDHGTLTKYFKMPDDYCYKLPEFMGLDEGVLVEPLAVAVHACRLADIKLGMDVIVFGAGTVGLLCAAVAKAMGAKKVVSVDINESRLKFAEKFAATGSYQPVKGNSAVESSEKIKKLHGLNDGADIVLEATGHVSCIDTGIQILRMGATFVQIGLGENKVEVPMVDLCIKEINLKGSIRYSHGDYDFALHLLEAKKLSVKELITGVEPFERTTTAWERTRKGDGIKNLIQGPQD